MFNNTLYWPECGIALGEQYSSSLSGNLSSRYMYMKMFDTTLTTLADHECLSL